MLEKTTRVNYLFDFYQKLLTPKQKSYMELYYLEDYSLGEISDAFRVSRQAVYDNIKRTEAMLEEYEEKLRLYDQFQKRQKLVRMARERLAELEITDTDLLSLMEQIENLD
ncbi:hypothetical protein EDD68_101153 [Melghiribacillus thermohalophilus]|uniref:UPF0122 protein EDD68_101153 n=1 Tax=Melghiribacillus thermohalophilus TaxID=1324956 RepID=A0A4R3ND17_9BACI|nr:putative DNA-binding protein [Melghiribacillus thermohalophilus]TCT26800.1 hypothetical protein EDD68_101153 [Melghiribacillus thermohalophilus]